MPVTATSRIGPYTVISSLGAGGMGEVFRARDERLGRDVAIKVLPSAFSGDADRLRRFEQEARAAAALNHPNILAIYDLGTHEDSPYLVSELLEGESLRERLRAGALSTRKAVDYALQMARGLAAAHEKGIVHRDLKPENIFVTRDGRVKILDFGLAKLTQKLDESITNAPTLATETTPGIVLGTVGYMSPEQVRGKAADQRSDIFSFGTILYEMLAGKRAFRGDSPAETMAAIVREDPPELSESNRNLPPALERIIRHCLEKNAEERFQSARDIAFNLEALSGVSAPTPAAVPKSGSRFAKRWLLAVQLLLLVAAVGIGVLTISTRRQVAVPSFHQLTFRRGAVFSARFAPGGQLVYSAAWEGTPIEIFSTRPEGPESRSLGLPSADVLAISSAGEMAISLGRRTLVWAGTLAQVPLSGGAPREIAENVLDADWSRDGANLAVVRTNATKLEFPLGKVLYETGGAIDFVRVSPKGNLIAFFEHPSLGDDAGAVAVVDLAGRKTTLSDGWITERGLAWSPTGDEVWFTASKEEASRVLYAVTLSGKVRLIARAPGSLMLHDISRDGRVLISRDDWRFGIMALPAGAAQERDLSWLNFSLLVDLSPDGEWLLLGEYGGGRALGSVYLRKMDGSPAIRLGSGYPVLLSPDGKWTLTFPDPSDRKFVLLPTGVGEAKTFDLGTIEPQDANWSRWSWSPDGRRIVFVGKDRGHDIRTYVQDLGSGEPRPVTPEGIAGALLSPDGRSIIVRGLDKAFSIYPVDGGEPHRVSGIAADEHVIRWSSDGKSLYVRQAERWPAQIYRLDLLTGRRTLWKELAPSDSAGLMAVTSICLSQKQTSYAYGYVRLLSDLYLVDGLR